MKYEVVDEEYRGKVIMHYQSLMFDKKFLQRMFAGLVLATGHTDQFNYKNDDEVWAIFDGSVIKASIVIDGFPSKDKNGNPEYDDDGNPKLRMVNKIDHFMEADKEATDAAAEMVALGTAAQPEPKDTGEYMEDEDEDDDYDIPF